MKSLFISLEGGEGAGKSTLLERLFEHFLKKNVPVIKTREPGGSKFGQKLREILLQKDSGSISDKAELFLFLADRAEHLNSIIMPALDEGKVVLCDRFNDSTRAYQGAARKIGEEIIDSLCQFTTDSLEPHLTFYLDIDPEVGLKRAASAPRDRIEKESLEFHRKVREGFLNLIKKYPKRIILIDASLSPEDVFQEALKWIP